MRQGPTPMMWWIRPLKEDQIQYGTFVGNKEGKNPAPESGTRDSYYAPSRASGPHIPCGTHVDKKAASDPPLGYNLPDK